MKERLSVRLNKIRDNLVDTRRDLAQAQRDEPTCQGISDVEGSTTLQIGFLYNLVADARKSEILRDDRESKSGEHIVFNVRGIGMDSCPGCFAKKDDFQGDGNTLMNNLSGFVETKEIGEKLVKWFGGLARLDFRESEPNWIQVKVGACDENLHKLEYLYKLIARYNVIRKEDIEEAIQYEEPPVDLENHPGDLPLMSERYAKSKTLTPEHIQECKEQAMQATADIREEPKDA